jgi:hypothetical protein
MTCGGKETIRMVWFYFLFFGSNTSSALKKSSLYVRLSFDKATIFSTCLGGTTTIRRPESAGGLQHNINQHNKIVHYRRNVATLKTVDFPGKTRYAFLITPSEEISRL